MSIAPPVLVPMQEDTIAHLMAVREPGDGSLDSIVLRLALERADPSTPAFVEGTATPRCETRGKWQAKVLGSVLRADALGQLFAEIVDVFHGYDPTVLERLSHHRSRTRRFIARTMEGVHGGRLDLGIVRTRSGWWVSGCVSARDVRRALEALCGEAELIFGQDIQFPVQ